MSFFTNLFSSKKKEEKKEEKDVSEKNIDDLINNNSTNDTKSNTKNSSASFFLSLDNSSINTERKILSEILKGAIYETDPGKLFDEFYARIKNWTYSKLKDEYRPTYASKSGGIEFTNKEITSMFRSTGVDLIKQIGKKIISGDFNLTTVSFPIKVMLPMTILQALAKSYFQFPIYLNLASLQPDPLERFKYVVVAALACFHKSSHFLKPLNPILGETFEMLWDDGSKLYLEQTSHHPPISHFYMVGPNKKYKYYGFSNFSAGAGFNSIKVNNKGKRTVEFPDGNKIIFGYCNEIYNNSFFGTIRHESIGDLHFKDVNNGFELVVKFDSVKKKPTDFFQGEIKLKNIVVSKIYGSYLSFIEFNNIRYWDIRENITIKSIEVEKQLKSSSSYREDAKLLAANRVDEAQAMKEKLEDSQRADKKLRHKFEKNLK